MGFINAVRIGVRIRRKGLMFCGLPCNSHSYMSSSVHQRSESLPFGNEMTSLVVVGNLLAYRTILLILLAISRSVAWALENPGGSKCLCLPAFAKLVEMQNLLRTTTCNWWGLQIEIYWPVLWTPGVFIGFELCPQQYVWMRCVLNIYIYIYMYVSNRKLGGENFRVTDWFMMKGGVRDFTSDDHRLQWKAV